MFSRLDAVRPKAREGGVAAVGLAVVAATVVVALVTTAVALSLTQEEKRSAPGTERDARAETMSGIKNAATAMEAWGNENGGVYIGACGGAASTRCAPFDQSAEPGPSNRLAENGLRLPPDVSVTVVRADAAGYCLQATHEDLAGYEVYFASEVGAPKTEPCT